MNSPAETGDRQNPPLSTYRNFTSRCADHPQKSTWRWQENSAAEKDTKILISKLSKRTDWETTWVDTWTWIKLEVKAFHEATTIMAIEPVTYWRPLCIVCVLDSRWGLEFFLFLPHCIACYRRICLQYAKALLFFLWQCIALHIYHRRLLPSPPGYTAPT